MARTLDGDEHQQHTPTRAAGRAAVAFACLALGMVVARHAVAVTPLIWWSVVAGAVGAGALMQGRAAIVALALGAAALGGAAFSAHIRSPRADALARLITAADQNTPLLLTVEGLALDTPRPPLLDSPMSEFGRAAPLGSFSLRAERVLTERGWEACDSTLWCRVRGTTYSSSDGLGGFGVRAGQRVRLTGEAEPPRSLDNPGQPDSRLYAAQAGVAGSLRVDSPDLVVVTEESAHGVRARLAASRDSLRGRALRALDFDPAGSSAARALVLSLFLGASEPGERDLRASFTRLGLAHVLAISGVHVIVMAGVARVIIRLAGERGPLEPIAVALLVVLYMLVVPVSAPVLRAGVITLALLASSALGRRYDRLAIVAWCACGVVLWRPLDLWSLGFQLSFGLTALLLWLGPRAHDNIFGPTIRGLAPVRRSGPALGARWLWAQFKVAFAASLLCWGASLPLIAFRTGLVSPLAVITSLVTLPVFTVLMWIGYLALIVGMAWPRASGLLHPALRASGEACVAIVERLDALPLMALRVPPFWLVLAAGASLLATAWVSSARLRDRRFLGAAGVLVLCFAAQWTCSSREDSGPLRLDALAVDEGSCTLVRSGRDRILWNAGSVRSAIGQRVIPSSLRELGAWRVPVVVITSPALHHMSAVPDLVEPLGIERVLLCGPAAVEALERPDSAAAWLKSHLEARGVEVRTLGAGDRLSLGECTVEFVVVTPTLSSNPDRPRACYALVRDSSGAPLALLAEDLSSAELEGVIASLSGSPAIITTGADVTTVRAADAIVLARRRQNEADDSLTFAVGERSAWAQVAPNGTCTAGRHPR